MSFVYRLATDDDADAMALLLRTTSEAFITGDFTDEAARRFLDGNGAALLRQLMVDGGFFVVARDGDELAGMIGVVSRTHIKYLFVGGRWHRRGLARHLLALAIAEMRRRGAVSAVSLNASDYGLQAYARLGFVAVAPRQEREGVWFTPMRLVVDAPLTP